MTLSTRFGIADFGRIFWSRGSPQHPGRRPWWVLAMLLAGCAAPHNAGPPVTGDILIDGPRWIAEGPARDKVLWQYRTAAAALRRGRFDLARSLLDEALLTVQGIHGPNPEARKARSLFRPEAVKPFVGEPYERSMAYIYRGILYWRDGELDNARACFRSAQFEDSDATDQTYVGDWVLPDYLDALATAKLGGDPADALRRAQQNVRGATLPPLDPSVNTLVFLEFGPGPVKYATGEYGEQLRFQTRPSPIRSARLRVGDWVIPVAAVDDVNYQATTRGGRLMDHVLGNKAVFKQATDRAGDAALVGGAILAVAGQGRKSAADETGAALLLAGLASKLISSATTPQADTRAWDNLPQFLSFAQLRLPPGRHIVTVEFLDAHGQPIPDRTKTVQFSVPEKGRDAVLFVSDTSTTPQEQ
ncbi:MAG: tetratricopeptide repeat protein [Verrucomicrobiota bacterium]|nr:tetratricopeptide repeat protein [Limisphaera sp.]MDW8382940.1 tetratricopeptide repeat protein [Verrucomicrobiota bacterium]